MKGITRAQANAVLKAVLDANVSGAHRFGIEFTTREDGINLMLTVFTRAKDSECVDHKIVWRQDQLDDVMEMIERYKEVAA